METLVVNKSIWKSRRVLVTGHTGFKGSWLCLWLHQLGASVAGLALDPPTQPNLYEMAQVGGVVQKDLRVDIRDVAAVCNAVSQFEPEVIFHLAAQPLVSQGYESPITTYATNVMGTAHILEAARKSNTVQAIVVVTTDKCYEIQDWVYPYRETDRLGGVDPYSSSKACSELVVSSYHSSFLKEQNITVATVRAGNVIGAGDWAEKRLLPDCIRAFYAGKSLKLRYPYAIRPWQHVLEPLSGYLMLAQAMLSDRSIEFCGAWNFGPDARDEVAVVQMANLAAKFWGIQAKIDVDESRHLETDILRLDSSKARSCLGWYSKWSLEQAVSETVTGYLACLKGTRIREYCLQSLDRYSNS